MTEPRDNTVPENLPRRTTVARVLAAVAGTGVGVRRSRRGSFLVLVVGTLALLSVFAILYVSIGNQDLRAKAALTRRENLDDVPRQFADYIATDIIGADALSVWYDPAAGSVSPLMVRREAMDYPSVDWARRSDAPARWNQPNFDASIAFSPVGTFDESFVNSTIPLSWLPTDPWLASTTPTNLNFNHSTPTDPDLPYLDRRDWAQISNVAPDGQFVNLAALRNDFHATHQQLGAGVTLFDPAGSAMPPAMTDLGEFIDPGIPAQWQSRQVRAFRPVTDSAGQTPGSQFFPAYQWADADGDGMLDSRLFEMAEYADRGNPAGDVVNYIHADSNYRYFFAVRIIDLSSMINVNAAGDFRRPPTVSAPVGTGGPAEVDLRRLLMLADAYDDNDRSPARAGGYDAIMQPNPASLPLGAYDQYTQVVAQSVGDRAYLAARLSLTGGFPLPRTTPDGQALAGPNLAGTFQTAYASTGATAQEYDFGVTRGDYFRRRYWERASGLLQGLRSEWIDAPGNATPAYRVAGAFGLDDLTELLTYFGANNDSTTSALETALGGRDNGTAPVDLTYFSPLRDNRGPDALGRPIERFGNFTPVRANVELPRVMLQASADIRRNLTTISGSRPLRHFRGADPGRMQNAELKLDAGEALESGNAPALYAGLAEALAPNTYARDSWNPSSSNFPSLATTYYGYRGPELALHVAAHMAVNMKDLYDYDAVFAPGTNPNTTPNNNPEQSVYTLVLNNLAVDRSTPNAPVIDSGYEPALFPAFARGQRLDLNAGVPAGQNPRLGDATSNLAAPLVNVYGIEPQPFITNVSTFTVYTDAPRGAGGDDEVGDGRNGATINGDIDRGNSDLLYRAIAIQITNPFDQAIDLSTGSAGAVNVEYYLRIRQSSAPAPENDQFYPLAGYSDFQTSSVDKITIPARSSSVVMILSTDLLSIRNRIAAVDPAASGMSELTVFKNIVSNAMSNNDTRLDHVYVVPSYDPITEIAQFPQGWSDLIYTNTPRIEMWRKRAIDREAGTTNGDQLIDRMRMPAGATLNHRLPGGQQEITGSDPDDDGYTLTMWSSVRRPADTSEFTNTTAAPGTPREPLGAFPAFCLEPKYRFDPANPSDPNLSNWNVRDDDQIGSSLSDADFDGTGRHKGNRRSVTAWRNAMSSELVNPTLGKYPGRQEAADNFGAARTAVAAGEGARASAYIPPGKFYSDLYPEMSIDNRRFRRPSDAGNLSSAQVKGLRVADLLLAPGIGPVGAPVNATGTRFDDTSDPGAVRRWTTLAESMAAAMGFENFGNAPAAGPSGDTVRLYEPVITFAGASYPLDRGKLRLDAFTPFLDANGNGAFDAPSDIRAGFEIPPALAVFDVFTVPPPGEMSITRMTPGLINLNTAPINVVRCLPMVSPITGTDPGTGSPNWWWSGGPLDVTADIAANLVGYRDRLDVQFRPMSVTGATAPFAAFSDTPNRRVPSSAAYANLNARSTSTLISTAGGAGVNEWPGFRTIGEAAAARNRVAGTPATNSWPSNMDGMANNGAANARLGVDSSVYQDGPTPGSPLKPSEVKDGYAEQLATLHGLLGSADVRSDVYACWFVVQGFKESDVYPLGANDPLVPSIKRRFLMIVDRSNVTKRGDKPHVLVFKELPVEN